MKRVQDFALAAIIVLTTFSGVYAETPNVKTQIFGPPLRKIAEEHDMLIGAAVEPKHLKNPQYAELLAGQFNYLTPENRMKWSFIHPEKDRYDFNGGDTLLEFAEAHDMNVRGHALVWHNQNPEWLDKGNWTKEELLGVLEDHIKTVVGHYKGRVYAWDVVNEALDGSFLRETLWQKTIGPEYLEKAFRWAHEADPDTKLYLNDYSVEDLNMKSNAMYELVKDLLERGVPIHGVGLQFHLELENPPDFPGVYANIKRFVQLGLDVDVTELDIRIRDEVTDDKLFLQAQQYKTLMEIALAFPECGVFTTWGFTDAHSWVPGFFSNAGSALLFDKSYNPKPAFYELQAALQAGPLDLSHYDEALNASSSTRHLIPAFRARLVSTPPVIDGVVSPEEWNGGILYRFAYNQLDPQDQRPPFDRQDLHGEWTVLYKGDSLYGLIIREDDVTVTTHQDSWENDTLEIFFEMQGQFAQLRSIVGQDWEAHSYEGERKIVWNEDGTLAEFRIALPEADLTGLTAGWNIALADNDVGPGNPRDHQLYPVYGFNDSWQGKHLCEITFEGNTPRPSGEPHIVPPFNATRVSVAPEVDGLIAEGEWDAGVLYQFAYNQLDATDQRPSEDYEDLYGEWKILYSRNRVYGLVKRNDDVTVSDHADEWENDALEVFGDLNGQFAQLRTVVGRDWSPHAMPGARKAVWNEDGTVLEFMVELPEDDLSGLTMGWNIALSDNDAGPNGTRDSQLYPIYGFNDSWQGKHLGEIFFQK